MKLAYFLFLVTLTPSVWVQAAITQSAQMTGVWSATGENFLATLELRYHPVGSKRVEYPAGQGFAFDGLLLTIHNADGPHPASLMAHKQKFSLVDVGVDACDIIYYRAVARGPSGNHLMLVLKDRRSVVKLDCRAMITQGHPSWSAVVSEVNTSADEKTMSVDPPIAHLDGEPDRDDGMMDWRDRQFDGAWVGIITQHRNPITGHAHYSFAAVENSSPYVLDLDSAHVALQYCGNQFMAAVLEAAGKAPLFDKGEIRNATYWRIVQCRSRPGISTEEKKLQTDNRAQRGLRAARIQSDSVKPSPLTSIIGGRSCPSGKATRAALIGTPAEGCPLHLRPVQLPPGAARRSSP